MDAGHDKQADTQSIVCKNCGAKMTYDPAKGCLHCDYCDTDEKIEAEQGEIKKYDINTAAGLLSHDWGTQTASIRCKNCGAQVVLEADKTADSCVFCGSPTIERLDAKEELAPGYVLPFKVTAVQAVAAFKNWLRHRSFAPHRLRGAAQMQKLQGVYIPHYAFDCDAYAQYTAWAGEDDKHLSSVRGEISRNYKNIVVPASIHINKKLEGNFGFMLGGLFKYMPQFISGFLAEKVSIPLGDGWKNATQEAERQIKSGVETKVRDESGAKVVNDVHLTVNYTNIFCAVLLLPIWLSVYTLGTKKYEFMINGQSGHVKGKAPVSALKILVYLAVTGLLFYLINLLSFTFACIVAFLMVIVMIGMLMNNSD